MVKKIFESQWALLKNSHEYGTIDYNDVSRSIKEIITSHFRPKKKSKKYGVYVIRQKLNNSVLYIGKGGTIEQNGKFKHQDIPTRLKNQRSSQLSAAEWFRSIVQEKGPLVIEYVFLTTIPQSPALVEALLIQEYLNEHGCLPCKNAGF